MEPQQLEYQLPDQIEQTLSGAGLMYFTYNRGITIDDSKVTAKIELKGSKHSFKITLIFDRQNQNATVNIDEVEGEAPSGNADKIVQLITALPPQIKELLT